MCEEITAIIDYKDKEIAPEGDLVTAFAAINDKTPSAVIHHHRYWLVELVMDGFNYEALFTQKVVDAEAETFALQQGADNNPIGYLVATLLDADDAEATVTYETAKGYLSGLHIHVSNRKGTKYQPTTMRFKVRGTRTEG